MQVNGDSDDDTGDEVGDGRHLGTVLAKAAAVVVVIGLLVFIATTLMVKALGLNSGGGNTATAQTAEPPAPSPLPSSALPVPGSSNTPEPGSTVDPSSGAAKGPIQLNISPAQAHPNQRVNLTGSYPGHDQMSLQVQRFESGQWTDFSGVTASVNLGTFQTYVMTGRPGPQKFRVFDPHSHKGSNPVVVVIG